MSHPSFLLPLTHPTFGECCFARWWRTASCPRKCWLSLAWGRSEILCPDTPHSQDSHPGSVHFGPLFTRRLLMSLQLSKSVKMILSRGAEPEKSTISFIKASLSVAASALCCNDDDHLVPDPRQRASQHSSASGVARDFEWGGGVGVITSLLPILCSPRF